MSIAVMITHDDLVHLENIKARLRPFEDAQSISTDEWIDAAIDIINGKYATSIEAESYAEANESDL